MEQSRFAVPNPPEWYNARVVVADDGPITVTTFGADGVACRAAVSPAWALALAGKLIEAAGRRLQVPAMSDTVAVSFEITGLERCHRGAVVATFGLRLSVDGIEIGTSGWQLADLGEHFETRAPRHRGADGRWVPSLDLPPELMTAVAAEVLAALELSVT